MRPSWWANCGQHFPGPQVPSCSTVLPLTEISNKESFFPGQWGSHISALKGLPRSSLACSPDPKRPCQDADQVCIWSGWVSEGILRHTLRDLRGICLNRVQRRLAESTINTTQDRDEVTETWRHARVYKNFSVALTPQVRDSFTRGSNYL